MLGGNRTLLPRRQRLISSLPSSGQRTRRHMQKPVQAQGLPMSATTPFPAMGALVSALLDIIAKVANAKSVPVPTPLAQNPTDDLAGKFAPAHPTRRDAVWPRFPAVTAFLSGAAAKPLQLFAPITAMLTGRSHQCAAPVAAATNTAFLAYSISKKAREMEPPPEFCGHHP
ncbi:hypothetical protein GOODEAATRI_014335 [Goodea atripinnis]|uniref:Uncharacterized protein n=1 Tax=Goodea atripinnis TaxID=208336 RepID=A0ABV0NUE8_9TELE